MFGNDQPDFYALLRRRPGAWAALHGGDAHPGIYGTARFYSTDYGVLAVIELSGLPTDYGECESPVYALHIHGGGECKGSPDDPFSAAGTHYNPKGCSHPYHAGDLPPVFNANGRALSASLTDRITVEEIIGKTIVLHERRDDFTTQPAGDSGKKIACGVVRA